MPKNDSLMVINTKIYINLDKKSLIIYIPYKLIKIKAYKCLDLAYRVVFMEDGYASVVITPSYPASVSSCSKDSIIPISANLEVQLSDMWQNPNKPALPTIVTIWPWFRLSMAGKNSFNTQ